MGGVIAFITSKGTMDKASPDVRRYIAQRAELLGAIRLPNNAFKANAGTEVTSDILFLQKREHPIDIEPDWIHLGQTADGIPINSYFVAHPDMMLGRMQWDKSMYGNEKETTCEPIPGADLTQQLHAAVRNIDGEYKRIEISEIDMNSERTIPADPDVRNFSYALVNGQVYYRENSVMTRPVLNQTTQERVKGMIELRDCVRKLIDLQLTDGSDAEIRAQQAELGRLYDAFSAEYGIINGKANGRAFEGDSSYYLLCSLEILDEDRKLKRKADIFSKRTIRRRKPVTQVDTASEALAVSIGERAKVDLPFMARLTGKAEDEIVADLQGVIFLDPLEQTWQTADEYLSGNVRAKLRVAQTAAESDSSFAVNVEALQAAQERYSNQIPRDGRRTGAAGTEDAGSGHDEHGRIPAEDGAGRLHSAARSAGVKRDAFPASLHGQQCQPDCQKSERGRRNRRDGHSRREKKTGADARTDGAASGNRAGRK